MPHWRVVRGMNAIRSTVAAPLRPQPMLSVVEPDRDVSTPGLSEDAFFQLYETSWARVVRLAYLLTSDQSNAEDIVQDAFAAMYRHRDRLRTAEAAFGYVRTAVVNGTRSSLRHRQVVARVQLRAVPELGADNAVLAREERTRLIAALHKLPQRQREVLVLRFWDDLSEAEIAHTLGVSKGTVKSSASRGLDALSQLMEG